MSRSFLSIAGVLFAAMLSSFAADSAIRWTDQYVEVQNTSLSKTNLTQADWQRLLTVRSHQGDLIADVTLPPMAGTYELTNGALRFRPRFPLEPGITYRAIYRTPGALALSATHRIEAKPLTPTTVVQAIYPSVETLPENLLKFYVYFSASMSGGHIYEHITLRDASGKPVELPFLEIDEELWNPDMTRLTLFLDPGRIKRGVKPLVDIGPSFEAGKSYTLTISTNWLDATGAKLKTGFEKKFAVSEADRDPPDPAKWKVHLPQKGMPLTIELQEPLDHAIMVRTLYVIDSKGGRIPGKSDLIFSDKCWAFTPDAPWKKGAYQVMVPTLIEDLAGNNIGKPFDVDLAQGERRLTNEYVRLPFRIE